MNRILVSLLVMAAALQVTAASAGGMEAGRYLTRDEFLAAAFPGGTPTPCVVWLTGDLKKRMEQALGHAPRALRVRGWRDGSSSAWILDEVGKEEPITIGVAVSGDSISAVRILEFRESRGWEVRYPFFTDQFPGTRLDGGDRLDRHIDGITGATLSVRAVKRVAVSALVLHEYQQESD